MRELDLRGLKCPLPVLRANKALKSMAKGEALILLTNDPRAHDELKEFCKITGYKISSCIGEKHECRLIIFKTA